MALVSQLVPDRQEVKMKRYWTVATAVAALVASLGIDIAVAQQRDIETTLRAEMPSPPSVDFRAVRTSL